MSHRHYWGGRILLMVAAAAITLLVAWGVKDRIVNGPWGRRPNNTVREGGLVIRGWDSPGSVTNTRPFPVRIRQVWVCRGESTTAVYVLAPGEQRPLGCVTLGTGFHVYSLDGIEIGWARVRLD